MTYSIERLFDEQLAQGSEMNNIEKVMQKCEKGLDVGTAANHLELSEMYVQKIYELINNDRNLTAKEIYHMLHCE